MSETQTQLRTHITKAPASLLPRPRSREKVGKKAIVPRQTGAHVWNRAKGESGAAFRAFVAYRDLEGKRSIRRAAEQVGKSPQLLERWSARWGWVDRAAQWDEEICRLAFEQSVLARMRMLEQQAELGRASVAKALEAVRCLDPKKLKAREAVLLAKEGSRMERLARGLEPDSNRPVGDPTVNTQVNVVWGDNGPPEWLQPYQRITTLCPAIDAQSPGRDRHGRR